LSLGPGEVHVWFAREQLLENAALSARFDAILAPEERERRDRMKSEQGRREQLLARGMLRELLSLYSTTTAPSAWRFVRGASGRPSLAPPFDATGLHFNLAHSAGLVAIAIARMSKLGVDVEHETRTLSPAIAERYFSAAEVAALRALPAGEQPGRRLRLWTLKEAYLKAIGTGVAGGLGSMTFSFGAGGEVSFERAGDPHAARWVFREFKPRGYVLALACLEAAAGAGPEPTLREFTASSGQEQRTQS
jgi:4'-phosphopantetheinyl transferase